MRPSFFFAILIILGASVYWNHKLYQEKHQEEVALEKEKEEASRLEHEAILARDSIQSQIESEKGAIRDLEDRIKKSQDHIESLEKTLNGTNDVPLGGNNPSTLQWDIKLQKEVVGDLERQIKDLKNQGSEIKSRKNNVLNQDHSARTESENAWRAQIQTQEQNLREAKGRLSQALRDRSSPDIIHALQAQVNDQQNFVNQLRVGRSSSEAQWNQRHNLTQGQAQQALDEIGTAQDMIQEKLKNEKTRLNDLQHELADENHIAGQYKGELSQIKKQLSEERGNLSRLQSERDDHSRRLNALTANR